ncbi:A24 family peptidase [Paenibacillus sp. UNC451MF]|uniref:A24 family peptidase n=1 Tax=Paenibacillus sp. UNC451MF TaxID=1449063 RepID=UPI00068C8DF2|nr:A24 family peptidase [Paenibacillus sp. UNC451MF]
MIFTLITFGIIIASFITDVRYQKIPNWLTVSGWLTGMALHTAYSGSSGALYGLIGTACGFVPMLLLYFIRAVGAGDVKLFGAIGTLAGGEVVLQSMMYSLFYAALVGCLILLWRRQWKQTAHRLGSMLWCFLALKDTAQWKPYIKSDHHVRFPFMWAVLPATITVFINVM